jgi:hypothetical protein
VPWRDYACWTSVNPVDGLKERGSEEQQTNRGLSTRLIEVSSASSRRFTKREALRQKGTARRARELSVGGGICPPGAAAVQSSLTSCGL